MLSGNRKVAIKNKRIWLGFRTQFHWGFLCDLQPFVRRDDTNGVISFPFHFSWKERKNVLASFLLSSLGTVFYSEYFCLKMSSQSAQRCNLLGCILVHSTRLLSSFVHVTLGTHCLGFFEIQRHVPSWGKGLALISYGRSSSCYESRSKRGPW
jgi:hypothetical protein